MTPQYKNKPVYYNEPADIEVISGSEFDIESTKSEIEKLAWETIREELSEGKKGRITVAKMVLEGKHYPKVNIKLTGDIEKMRRNELVEHMGRLLSE